MSDTQALVRFESETVLADAAARARLDDFGDEDFLEPMRRLLDAIENEAALHAIGRVTMYERVVGSLVDRLSAQEHMNRHPEILEEEIHEPIVIVGLGRTGSTMLHRLLAADPKVYSVRWWECRWPSPYPDSDWRRHDPRIPAAHREVKAILEAAPELETIHPWDPEGPDEEIMLLEHAFLSYVPEAFCNVPSYSDYITNHDLEAGYRYMKRMLQFLQWQKKEAGQDRERWILKAPFHIAWIDNVCRLFPDATIVQTHRDPIETMPSLASLYTSTWRTNSDRVDPHEVGRQILERWSWAISRGLASRDGGLENHFVDLLYEENRKDPMKGIARIYEKIGHPFTDAAREAMKQWGDENRRDKRGTHTYSLEEFGFIREAIDEAFRDYRERFILGRAESR
ncbi:MAG: sulfotransferase [Deltaproteobacteria bacterium]|nr:sulfotransferase [Deltaproteobacteria bacterium]